jgi:hypothetical protein
MKRDEKVAEMAGDCGELRNCGSQILKVRNRSAATMFSPQFHNRFFYPQYCGGADLNCGCPPLPTSGLILANSSHRTFPALSYVCIYSICTCIHAQKGEVACLK